MKSTTERALAPVWNSDTSMGARLSAIESVRALGDPDSVLPLGILLDETDDDALRCALREALLGLGGARVLLGKLRDSDEMVRIGAAQALRALGDPSTMPALIETLSDPIAKVREQAASALMGVEDPRAAQALVALLVQDADPDVRGAAAQALGEIPSTAAKDALNAAMGAERDPFTLILIERSIARWQDRIDRMARA